MTKGISYIINMCVAAVAVGLIFMMSAHGAEAKAKEKVTFDIAQVEVQPTANWSEKQLKKLVPELEKEKVDLKKLSHQVQLTNESKAVKLNADLQPLEDGKFKAVLTAEEQKTESVAVNVNNTGNYYTGNWRMSATFMEKNLTGVSDSLGVAYVTSPGHWEDVKQAAMVYRAILPRAGDSLYISASWSDVDLGNIGNFGGIGVGATGRGTTIAAHYQHNIKYTSSHKQILDFGVDQKSYRNATNYDYLGTRIDDDINYDVALASVTYVDIHKKDREFLAWNVGYSTNLTDDDGFKRNRANSDGHFHLFKAGFNYQTRTKNDWILGFRLNGQYTNDNVVTTEQFGVGGLASVRGFKERVAYADKGLQGSFEIYTPEIGKHSRFVIFTDCAYLSNNDPRRGELDSDHIGSYGLGYRYYDKKGGWSVSVDYAHAYSNVDGARDNLRPWHVSFTKEF